MDGRLGLSLSSGGLRPHQWHAQSERPEILLGQWRLLCLLSAGDLIFSRAFKATLPLLFYYLR